MTSVPTTQVLTPGSPTDDAVWRALLLDCAHDFYHLPGYVQLEADRIGGQARGFWVEFKGSRLLLPLILRPVPPDLAAGAVQFDGMSPYGYPAPLFDLREPGHAAGCLRALLEALRQANVCAAFVRMHPKLVAPLAELEAVGQVVRHGETVWIDLSLAQEEMWRQTRKSDRNRINKMRRTNVVARMDPDWTNFEEFLAIYEETMRHVDAASWYFFDRSYFERLRTVLGARGALCVVEIDGQVVSAGIFTECGGIVQYHLSGTLDEHRRLAPSRLMLDHVRTWAKQQGQQAFHLGGGLGGGADSLFNFKAGFSKLRADFCTWRLIPDPDEYERLVVAWRERNPGVPDDGFFPLYRKPSA